MRYTLYVNAILAQVVEQSGLFADDYTSAVRMDETVLDVPSGKRLIRTRSQITVFLYGWVPEPGRVHDGGDNIDYVVHSCSCGDVDGYDWYSFCCG
jgi:hypothetical protein